MGASPLIVVTQVAPYPDGPAGVHGVLPQAAAALDQIGTLAGLAPRTVGDVTDLDPADLADGGVLALFTIGETPWTAEQRAAISDGLRGGRLGLMAVHSATDACRGWDEYGELLGARFDGHPWTQTFEVQVTGPTHPATAHLASPFTWHDELYLFSGLRGDATVLLRASPEGLDMTAPGARIPDIGLPLCWSFTEQAGRVFYSALGHFSGAWENPVYLRHIAGGLEWVQHGA